MARNAAAHAGRTLIVFVIGIGVLFGLVAIGGTWKPALGLDLQGGTRITLTANGDPTQENLDEAASIIDSRVNATGFSEAEVTTQGSQYIVVEVPGNTDNSLLDTVNRQAQLRFRTVACTSTAPGPCASAATPTDPTADPSAEPGVGVTLPADPSESPSAKASDKAKPKDKSTAKPKNRPAFMADEKKNKKKKQNAAASPSASPTAAPSESASVSPSASPSATRPPGRRRGSERQGGTGVHHRTAAGGDRRLRRVHVPRHHAAGRRPDDVAGHLWHRRRCHDEVPPLAGGDRGHRPEGGLGGRAAGPGRLAGQPTLGGDGKKVFADLSNAMAGSEQQFAVVLDGMVISAPTFEGRIPDGNAQISGNFTQKSAESLATSLKFGALPISFDREGTQVEEIGPSLAGNQLQAGLTAGLLGLILVMGYCLVYYRGLGLVVLASLLTAAGITYGMVLLLGSTAGFTLTLPGIAGPDHRCRCHRGLVHHLLRTHPRRDARGQVDAGCRGDGLGPREEDPARGQRGLPALGRRALPVRDRSREGLRFRPGSVDPHRPGDPLLVHQADGDVPGTVQVLQRRRRALGPEREHARHRPRRHGR